MVTDFVFPDNPCYCRYMPKFWGLFWTQFLGALNDNVLKNAMVVMITYKGLSVWGLNAPSIVALSGGVFILPFFLFSMTAGQLADKYEKSRIVRYVKIWELFITLLASAGFYTHNVVWLLGALFMMGTHSTFFGPVKYSALPDLVHKDQLLKANAYVELGTFLAILIGTILGGFLVALKGGEFYAILAINLFALMGILTSWRVPRLPSQAEEIKVSFNPISPIAETMRLLHGRKDVWVGILAISWFWFYGAAILSVLPTFCKDVLKVDEHVVTAFLAMWTFGIGLGAILCEKVSQKRTELGIVPFGAAGLSLFLFDLSRFRPELKVTHEGLQTISQFLSTTYGYHLLMDFLLIAISGGLFIVPLYTLLQERSDPRLRSRVIAGNNVINAVFIVVSAVLVMAAHAFKFTISETLFAVAFLNTIFSVYIFLTVPEYFERLRRRLR